MRALGKSLASVAALSAVLDVVIGGCGSKSEAKPFVTTFCRTTEPAPPNPEELTVGALILPTVPDIKSAYDGDPPRPDPDGVTFYKAGIAVRADHPQVTLTIAAPARAYARIENESYHDPSSHGAVSITYAGKPRLEPERTWTCWYVGGYNLLHGQTTACLPLDVTIAGDPAVHHVTVPIGRKCSK
jgi:hypothetical protein